MARQKRCQKCGLIDVTIRAIHSEFRKRKQDFSKLKNLGDLLLTFDEMDCDPGCPTIQIPRNPRRR